MSAARTTNMANSRTPCATPTRPAGWHRLPARAGLLLLITVPMLAAASGNAVRLDKAPGDLMDKASLQRGAKFFVANCLSCHGATSMRYNRLGDVGLSESEIKELLPEGAKPGSTMQAAMTSDAARQAFGAAPPDLSVEARVRGKDWLYTYLRSFYRDPATPTGVNNLVFPSVAMPNVLGGLQGEQELVVTTGADGHPVKSLKLSQAGSLSSVQFDATIADLVNFMDFMAEPAKLVRRNIGYGVLGFLLVLLILTYRLKKEVWKDVR